MQPQSFPSISVLLADIDGTVVTRDKIVTERAQEAVQHLREQGVIFTVTSSRPPRGMRMLVEPLGLTMPMAAFNGGVIVLPDLSVLDAWAIPDYLMPGLVETMEAQGLDIWLFTADDWYVRDRKGPRVDREAATLQFEPTVVPSFDKLLTGIIKVVGVSTDHARIEACEALLQQEWGSLVSAVRSHPQYLDVTHPRANKGTVIERLSRYLNVPLEHIATIGDHWNDVPMFRRSGLSIAMGNASDQVQRHATCVTGSFADEGFATAIDTYILPRAEPATSAAARTTGQLHRLGQSLWLDNITRDLLTSGTLEHYVDELSVTGLTSNPTIFENAIKSSAAYDAEIRQKLGRGHSSEEVFFEIALDDLTRAADVFLPIHHRTSGVDGWVSLEVSPHLAYDAARTLAAAKDLFARAGRRNLMIKIPGTREGLPAIEEAIFAGIPINVTLLFSREQYFAAAEAFMRGIERRIDAGLPPEVASVASMFVSRWDAAVKDKVPDELRNQIALAMSRRTYRAYRSLLGSPRWQRVYNAGARPQRLLWASTGSKDPLTSDVMYIRGLAAPFTVNTMPQATLEALAGYTDLPALMRADGGDCEQVLARFADAGIDIHALAQQLQHDGAAGFVASWNGLMGVIDAKAGKAQR